MTNSREILAQCVRGGSLGRDSLLHFSAFQRRTFADRFWERMKKLSSFLPFFVLLAFGLFTAYYFTTTEYLCTNIAYHMIWVHSMDLVSLNFTIISDLPISHWCRVFLLKWHLIFSHNAWFHKYLVIFENFPV